MQCILQDLLVLLKVSSFLVPVSVKKCGINIKEHEFRLFNGIDDFAEFHDNETELSQGILIHTVKKAGQRWLGCQGIFIQDGGHNGFIG